MRGKMREDIDLSFKGLLKESIPKEWVTAYRKTKLWTQTNALRLVPQRQFDRTAFPDGINLIGNIRLNAGLGQSMRLVADELKHSGVPFCIYEHHISKNFSMTDHTKDGLISNRLLYNVNLIHVNPHEFAKAYFQMGKKTFDRHYNIVFWLWELEEFPDLWKGCFNVIDEIWTPAEFVSEAIRKKTDKPVYTIPYHVDAPTDPRYDRAYFNLPEDQFLFLTMYDYQSMADRKNPQTALMSFKRAFPPENDKVGFVVKLNDTPRNIVPYVRMVMEKYSNVYMIPGILSKAEVNSLIGCVDAFVSTHRAEGFGLVMAESMLNGVPCIATNWSANTEFMNSDVACMVNYRMVKLKQDIGPYVRGSRWAEPSIASTAGHMKRLYEDKEYYKRLSEDGKKYLEEKLGMERIAGLIRQRIAEILPGSMQG